MFAGLQPQLIPYATYFFNVLQAYGYRPRITSVFRSRQQQAILYSRYLRGLSGGLPAAPPGRSLHEQGRAFDLVVTSSGAAQAGAFWKALGGRWYPSDPVHFEA